jgi:kinesin family protein 1|uniref:Kinesin motor domain-containing protein n=1 Tax=Eutreptiella gymnastica TaxID=73025 RepID=A0A7S4FYE6_9EUGL|mmetsp:Transcript_50966/g.85206  ORF Transcript_50966/g.85206 Transcript_50966/m.85206 type:complete len:602 (-) Transcript_50966:494-2299(-)|eukprot:CAMPEP_0174300004 /NCGR_PEP_ID=MMETSP0809-20121228/58222_1 /TAXON_ID=73025 ORGANISM="Eutreptiella gymnastica-like, Strain CCMP1594" /NCGR_SAMPLE_ID=MMETSP0809 /ASSEMBLY_ACC=CAM_ASM_000658 /LENGTH=601 /DNA_ID=CAMNT_0015405533 /DNA_START=34 /DNA_END=1839 /DNA_ORIENTATION=+
MGKKAANDNVRVMVRVRPFNSKEINENGGQIPFCTVEVNSETVITSKPPPGEAGNEHSFPFDHIFWSLPADQMPAPVPFADQPDVYNIVGVPQLDSMFDGYNGCIFAYGQTSSGKSHSMMGYEGKGRGVSPRMCEEMFARIEEAKEAKKNTTYSVKVAMLQIYNEQVQDLLKKGGPNLKIVNDPQKGPTVRGLIEKDVHSWDEVNQILDQGIANRSVAATAMNATSSRAHTVIQLSLDMVDELGQVGAKKISRPRRSRANLVDLAGSEKISKSKVEGANLKEAIGINQSLTCLGRVIDHLVDGKPHIPYRDSVLTTLLADSLGGNSRTTMLAALSPAAINYDETVSTLRYASRARKIVNQVKVNEDPTAALIRELQEELAKMKQSVLTGDVDTLQQIMGTDQPISAANMAAKTQELETVIEQIAALEQKEQEEEEKREQQWISERSELEARHNEELAEIEGMRAQLEQQKVQLEEQQQQLQANLKVKQRGVIMNRMQGLTRLAAAQQKAAEHDETKKDLQREMIVNRLRTSSEKQKYKQAIDEARAVQRNAATDEERCRNLEQELEAARAYIAQLEIRKFGPQGKAGKGGGGYAAMGRGMR